MIGINHYHYLCPCKHGYCVALESIFTVFLQRQVPSWTGHEVTRPHRPPMTSQTHCCSQCIGAIEPNVHVFGLLVEENPHRTPYRKGQRKTSTRNFFLCGDSGNHCTTIESKIQHFFTLLGKMSEWSAQRRQIHKCSTFNLAFAADCGCTHP